MTLLTKTTATARATVKVWKDARKLMLRGFTRRSERCTSCRSRTVLERGVEHYCLRCGYGALWDETKANEIPWLLPGKWKHDGDRVLWTADTRREA